MVRFNSHKFIRNFTHICKKLLQICVKWVKLCLVGLSPGQQTFEIITPADNENVVCTSVLDLGLGSLQSDS
jgi:hypothetical protein